MEAVVHKAKSFAQAETWDIQQQLTMSPAERMQVAKTLKARAFPAPNKDVREWHRDQ